MVHVMIHVMAYGAGADVYAHISGFVVKEIREGVHLDVAVLPSCRKPHRCYKRDLIQASTYRRDLVTHTKETCDESHCCSTLSTPVLMRLLIEREGESARAREGERGREMFAWVYADASTYVLL